MRYGYLDVTWIGIAPIRVYLQVPQKSLNTFKVRKCSICPLFYKLKTYLSKLNIGTVNTNTIKI